MNATYLLMKAFAARERDQVQRHLSRLYDLLNVNHPSSFIIRPLLQSAVVFIQYPDSSMKF
jgi:hypothetical protein